MSPTRDTRANKKAYNKEKGKLMRFLNKNIDFKAWIGPGATRCTQMNNAMNNFTNKPNEFWDKIIPYIETPSGGNLLPPWESCTEGLW